jgi:hypothetical protein
MRKAYISAGGAMQTFIDPITSLTLIVAGQHSIKRYLEPSTDYLTPTVCERRSSAPTVEAI